MKAIHTWQELQQTVCSFPIGPEIAGFLEQEFKALHKNLGNGESLQTFDLSLHGPLWIAEPEETGITWVDIQKRLGVHQPEFVEQHHLPSGEKLFRVVFMADNDYLTLLYLKPQDIDPELLEWLSEEAHIVEAETSCGEEKLENPF